MSELFEKSIQILELPRVLEQLAACAVTDEGKDRCRALRPMTDQDDVQRAQEESHRILQLDPELRLPEHKALREKVDRLYEANSGGFN